MTSIPDAVLGESVVCNAGRRPTSATVHSAASLTNAFTSISIRLFLASAGRCSASRSRPLCNVRSYSPSGYHRRS